MAASPHPLVLIPQYFGSLVFDRRTSRYLPFDSEATVLLRALHERPIDAVLAAVPDADERAAVRDFISCFYERGFFGLNGRLAAQVLNVDMPADHLVGPLAVHLEIVGACNLTCSHCFAGVLPRNHHPLTVAEMDRLFGDLAQIGSLRLGLTGGEPLLRKDLCDILDAATVRGLHPCLTTNGLLLTEEIARQLGQRELVWLNVSLDGPDAATNDAVRGAGTFAAVLEKLKVLRRHARFTLAFTVMRTNADLVTRCAELAYCLGAHTAVFRPLYPAGVALQHLDLMPTFEQYSQALDELADMVSPGTDLRSLDAFGPESRGATQPRIHTSHTCGAGQHVCSISVQGDVNPCSFLGPAFNGGNIRDTPFAVLWRTSQQFRRMRQASAGGFEGGCRARSLAFAGSADAADPWFAEYVTKDTLPPGANVEADCFPRSLPLVSR
jgi:[mycofactocin precursor peptide]-tyrosine decarboxylase / 3-amino-5-[(4-hydroxyphenyl)methyl]-4,4-dimethylpyrrolidin-2-one synthase